MNKLNVTKGEWEVNEQPCSLLVTVKEQNNKYFSVCQINTSGAKKGEAEANSKLIADAGTTYNKCQQLPSELLQQNEELKEALKKFFETTYHFTVQDALKNAKEVLTKRPKP